MGWIIQEYLFLKMGEEKKLITKKSVKSFNHIDETNQERKEELEKLYSFYHKLWYCYKKVHPREKKNLGLNLVPSHLCQLDQLLVQWQ